MTARALLILAALTIVMTSVAVAVFLPSICFFPDGPTPVPAFDDSCVGLRGDGRVALRVGVGGLGLTLGLLLGAFASRQPPDR